MTAKAILALILALTASLIRVSWTYEVELVASPGGPVVTAPAGKPFSISCQALGGDKSQFSLMKWLDYKGNVIGEGSPGVVKGENNLLYLTFTDPKHEDSGTYRCTATYAKEYNLHYTLNIDFYGPAPEFDATFENLTVTEGERVEAFCTATGETPMSYKWYNEASDLIPENPNLPVYVSSSVNGSWLNIEKVELRDEGMYTCTAQNTHGLKSKLYHLTVLPRTEEDTNDTTPVIRDISVANVSANSVTFRIVFSGFARYIEANYSENRSPTPYNKLFQLTSDDMYTILDLVPSGAYSFQFRILPSEDVFGTWSKTINVTLLPGVPELTFRSIENGNVYFEWFRTFDDAMRETIDRYEIKYYTVQMQGGNSWISSTCAVTIQIPFCRGTSYRISGLSQKVYYMIEVRAHTASGYGESAKQKIYIMG